MINYVNLKSQNKSKPSKFNSVKTGNYSKQSNDLKMKFVFVLEKVCGNAKKKQRLIKYENKPKFHCIFLKLEIILLKPNL